MRIVADDGWKCDLPYYDVVAVRVCPDGVLVGSRGRVTLLCQFDSDSVTFAIYSFWPGGGSDENLGSVSSMAAKDA